MGAHKRPFYRIVAADARSPRDGRFIEELGYYNPLTDPADVKIDVEKARKWISTGAKPTDTVRGLLKKAGVFEVAKQADTAPESEAVAPTEASENATQEPAEAAPTEAIEEPAEAAQAEAIEAHAEVVQTEANENAAPAEADAEPVADADPAQNE
jgi:small subunit ribosomal protein S16